MFESKIRTVMAGAVQRFAKNEQVSPKEISIVIHTKNEEYLPEYYYLVKNVPKKDEHANVLELKFKRDILNKSFDPIGTEGIVAHFLSNKFKMYEELYEEQNISAKALYFIIYPNSENADDFDVFLFHNKNLLKKLTLSEIVN